MPARDLLVESYREVTRIYVLILTMTKYSVIVPITSPVMVQLFKCKLKLDDTFFLEIISSSLKVIIKNVNKSEINFECYGKTRLCD